MQKLKKKNIVLLLLALAMVLMLIFLTKPWASDSPDSTAAIGTKADQSSDAISKTDQPTTNEPTTNEPTTNEPTTDEPSINDSKQSIPPGYATANPNTLWFAGTEDGVGADAVLCQKNGNTYHLFLPPSANLNNIKVWHKFSDLDVNGVTIVSGEKTDAFKNGSRFTLQSSSNTYMLEISQSDHVGAIFLDTNKPLDWINEDKNNECPGTALIVSNTGKKEYSGELVRLRMRGNTSLMHNKKPYNIKFPAAESLFGMTPAKKYSLIANAQDDVMLRNIIAYDLAAAIGMPYSPKSHFVELYVCGEYLGSYQLAEKIEIGKNYMINDIGDLENRTEKVNDGPLDAKPFRNRDYWGFDNLTDPADITGPYLLEGYYKPDDKSGFRIRQGSSGEISINSPERASKAQVEYISDFYQDMENAVFSATGKNTKGKHFTEYINLESAAKMFWIQEFTMNHDGGSASCYFWKAADSEGDGKLHLGPAWDFDNTFGNAAFWGQNDGSYTYIDLSNPEGLWISRSKTRWSDDNIFAGLLQHKEFGDALTDCWEEFSYAVEILLGIKPTDDSLALKSVDEYGLMLASSATMNYKIREKIIHTSGIGAVHNDARYQSYFKGIDYLKTFAEMRFGFLMDYIYTPIKNGEEMREPSKLRDSWELPKGEEATLYYYNNENWSTVASYCWEPHEQLGRWYGVKCEDLGNGWWSVKLPEFIAGNHIIFNDFGTDDKQTSNKLLLNDRIYFWGSNESDDGRGSPGSTYDEAVAQWSHAPSTSGS